MDSPKMTLETAKIYDSVFLLCLSRYRKDIPCYAINAC